MASLSAGETTQGRVNAVAGPLFYNPPDGASVCEHQLTFGWNGGMAASYHFELDDDPSFAAPEITVDMTETIYQPLTPLPDGIFYYRVRATDLNGRLSDFSAFTRNIH